MHGVGHAVCLGNGAHRRVHGLGQHLATKHAFGQAGAFADKQAGVDLFYLQVAEQALQVAGV